MTPDPRLTDTRLHPELRARVQRILDTMAAAGHPMRVAAGYRTVEEQQRLYAKGRTIPPIGRSYIVTHCDGVRTRSNHQGGRAVDCVFLVHGKFSWDARLPWALFGQHAVAEGLVWGGNFKSLRDYPHVELPKGFPDVPTAPAPTAPATDDGPRPTPGPE